MLTGMRKSVIACVLFALGAARRGRRDAVTARRAHYAAASSIRVPSWTAR